MYHMYSGTLYRWSSSTECLAPTATRVGNHQGSMSDTSPALYYNLLHIHMARMGNVHALA